MGPAINQMASMLGLAQMQSNQYLDAMAYQRMVEEQIARGQRQLANGQQTDDNPVLLLLEN